MPSYGERLRLGTSARAAQWPPETVASTPVMKFSPVSSDMQRMKALAMCFEETPLFETSKQLPLEEASLFKTSKAQVRLPEKCSARSFSATCSTHACKLCHGTLEAEC